jgi:hypothetical protein
MAASTICDKDATQLDRQEGIDTERIVVAVTLCTSIRGVLGWNIIPVHRIYDRDFVVLLWDRFPMSLIFSIYLILPAVPWPKGLLSLQQK